MSEIESQDANRSGLVAIATRGDDWLRHKALRLWAANGFDEPSQMFQERLDWTGRPETGVSRRLMVQARQVAVYAAAGLSGRFASGCEIALAACRSMIANYHAVDGRPGWVFSIDADRRPVDARRDLYAHAFVLFALAWAMRCKKGDELGEVVEATLHFIDQHMADQKHGGYWDCVPAAEPIRSQNPHMHLFEALLALNETRRDDAVLDRCRALRQLAIHRFIVDGAGALCEEFQSHWTVHPEPGKGRIEPGHLFEWAWLLRRFEHATGEPQSAVVSALIGMATGSGLNRTTGRIIDEVSEIGIPIRTSSRSWPHAEALKSLTTESALGVSSYDGYIAPIAARLLDVHCPASLAGGWIDHVDSGDKALSRTMPASSLYHLYFGLTALDDVARPAQSVEAGTL